MEESQIPQLIINNLAFERNYQTLFHSINATLSPGECLQIEGKNGSGKSTLLRILSGLIEPENGTVLWKGKSIQQNTHLYHQELHYIGHQNALKPQLTVYENLKLHCALTPSSLSNTELLAILETMNLERFANIKAQSLSAGQQRRLNLARLHCKKASLWILDEPTTALDRDGYTGLMHALAQHILANGMIVISTHQPLSTLNTTMTVRLGDDHA